MFVIFPFSKFELLLNFSGPALPAAADMIAGSVILKFDSGDCNLLYISLSLKTVFQCTDNLNWKFYIQNNLPTGIKQLAKTDAVLFSSFPLRF